MAEAASSFVRDWISENVTSDPVLGDDTDVQLAATMTRLMAAAREADVDLDDPEMAPDLLRDLIHAAMMERS
jgi:hypothetical protein